MGLLSKWLLKDKYVDSGLNTLWGRFKYSFKFTDTVDLIMAYLLYSCFITVGWICIFGTYFGHCTNPILGASFGIFCVVFGISSWIYIVGCH